MGPDSRQLGQKRFQNILCTDQSSLATITNLPWSQEDAITTSKRSQTRWRLIKILTLAKRQRSKTLHFLWKEFSYFFAVSSRKKGPNSKKWRTQFLFTMTTQFYFIFCGKTSSFASHFWGGEAMVLLNATFHGGTMMLCSFARETLCFRWRCVFFFFFAPRISSV